MSTKTTRINLFAGPCCGKSTAAAWLFSQLKVDGYNADLVQEKVKELVYSGRTVQKFDQFFLMSEQMRREELLLRNKVLVVTDSPLRLGIAYGKKYGFPCIKSLLEIADAFDADYPALNVYLRRNLDFPYKQEGRYENFEQAIEMDSVISDIIKEAPDGFVECDGHNLEALAGIVKEKLSI